MTTGITANPNASLAAAAAQAQSILSNPTVMAALGGGAAAGTAGAPAAGAAAPAANTTTPTPVATRGITANNVTVQIVRDQTTQKHTLVPATGKPERVKILDQQGQLTGQTMQFGANGFETSNFETAARTAIFQPVLDRRDGIASGITNLSRVVSARHERLKALQDALAQDANQNGGSANQMDLQQLVQEQQITEHISNLNHKIYESVQNAITPWLR